MDDEEADFNPTKDLEKLERLLAEEPQSNFMKIQSYHKDILSPGSEDEEYAMAVRDLRVLLREEEIRRTTSETTKRSFFKKAEKTKKAKVKVDLEPDEWIKDSGCSKHMTGNQKLFSTYKAYNGGNVIFGSNLRGNIIGKGQICDNKCRVTFSKHDSEITKDGKVIGYSQNGKAYIILNKHTRKVKELLNVTFDEIPPPSKTSPLVDDDLDEEKAIKVTKKKNLENDIVDETLEVDEIVSFNYIKSNKNVIGLRKSN
ncbi:hypothetical protein Tco_1188093 [Tanacetum coccineum]